MNRSMLIAALLAALSLAACDKPTVVNVPPTPAAVPGPAGPQGAPGNPGRKGDTVINVPAVPGPAGPQGATGEPGSKGETGKSGDSPAVIVIPPAPSAPAK